MSADLFLLIAHLTVDTPTESGDWCVVDVEGIHSPVNIEVSTWTEIVDEDDDRVDEDDPIALANGHEVTRVSVHRYDPGREERYDITPGKRWVRFEVLMEELAKHVVPAASLASERDAAIARAEAAEREHEATKSMVRTLAAIEVEEPETDNERFDHAKRRLRALVALASRVGAAR
jgi:hypothetical protein